MTSAARLLFALFLTIGNNLPICAADIEDLVFLTDLPDDNEKDQIRYTVDGNSIKWTGYQAFTGHIPGQLYSKGKLTYHSTGGPCGDTYDFDASVEIGVNHSAIISLTSAVTDPPGWTYQTPPPAGEPEQDEIEGSQVCATCSDDGYNYSNRAKAELDEPKGFGDQVAFPIKDSAFPSQSFSFAAGLEKAAYQTNIDRWLDSYRTWHGWPCEGDTQMDAYKFTLADYGWVRQTSKIKVRAKCPGKYTLYYTVGQFTPDLWRGYCEGGVNQYSSPCATVTYQGRSGLQRKKIEVMIGEDGWADKEIELPMPEAPSSEDFTAADGYELISLPEQAEAYGIDLNRDANGNPDLNIWKDYGVVLEPVDCGCDGDGGGGGGGGGSGGGGSGSAGGPGSGGARVASVNFDVNLGRLTSGDSAGRISLRSPSVVAALLSPAALELVPTNSSSWATEIRSVTVDGVLRQVRAPQTFVDIVTTSATSYLIRFYAADAGGTYDPEEPVASPTGTPHTTWTVAPGTASGTVAFTRANGTTPAVWEFRPLPDGGTEMLRNGVIQTHSRTSDNGAVIEVRKTIDPVYGLLSHTRQTWRMENGQIVKKEDVQLDADGNLLRGLVQNTGSYFSSAVYRVGTRDVYWPSSYSSGGTTSTSTSYAGGGYDSRSSTTGNAGDQDGDQQAEKLTTITSSSYPDNRQSITHVVSYTAPFAHAGVNYKKEETRQATNSSSIYWSSPGKRITTRWTFADGDHEEKNAWEFYPDDTATRWTYDTDTSGNTVTVQESGKPDPGTTAILYGTRSTQVEDTQGRFVSSEDRDISTDLVFASEEVLERDPVHGTPTLIVRNGKEETRSYSPCCGRLETIIADGLVRTLLYDGLDREVGEDIHSVAGTFVSGERNELDALGRVRKTYQRLGGTNERLTATADYDLAGNLTGTWRLGSGAVTYSETVNSNGQWVKTTSRTESAPGAGDALEEVTLSSGNRIPLEFRRNGVLITKWLHGYADEGRFITEVKVGENDAETETVTSVYSMLGELVRVEYPHPQDAFSENAYDDAGRLLRQTDPDGVQTLYDYLRDADGEHVVTALDMNRDGEINYGASGPSADRITRTTSTYGTRNDLTVAKTVTAQWIEDGDTPRTVSVDEMAVDGSCIWRTVLGTQTTQIVISHDAETGVRTETTTLPDQTQTILTSLGDRITSEVHKNADGGTVVSTTNEYDGHGRLWKVNDARGTTTLAYYPASDLLHTVTTPNPGDGAKVTTYAHNNRGAVTSVTHPDNTTTYRQYWADGAVKRVWGSRTYPEYRTYDRQGRLKTLTTWQDYNPVSHSGTGEALTTWNYHSQRGWLENKRYRNDHGPSYTYTPAGRPLTRTWVRTATAGSAALTTTYAHNEAGELASIDYSDTTPDVTHVYDRAGRLKTTTDAAGLLTRSYDPASLNLSGEAYTGAGWLAGRSLARSYDLRYRPQSLATDGGYALGYGYDNAGRLETLNQGFHSAVFGYEPGTSAHNKTTIKRVGVERVRNERVFDAIGRVDLVRSVIGGTNQVLRDYALNAADQRTGVELEDGRRWAYGYDDLGQVTSAQKRLADNTTPLPGYTFGYTFDDIGNRIETVINSRATTYTPDLLNRYTSRQVAGAVDVRGEAASDVDVLVDDEPVTRSGKDFYRAVPKANASGAVSGEISVLAARLGTGGAPDQVASEDRPFFLPRTPEVFTYDDDGNLTQDGRWDFRYDAENRLVQVETRPELVAQIGGLGAYRLTFAYDAQSRRIRKLVETWNAALNSGAGGWETTNDLRFLYDGFNLLTELDALNSNALVRSYAWGLDLSGTLQGAGGVGGLLWANTPTHTFAASADGNGNLVAFTNTATLALAGRADYDAFGVPLMRTGVANSLPFGFSSNYTDPETGLVYFDFIRYYHPGLGRWTTKDPSGESSGRNLYGMLNNDAVNAWDYLGLWEGPYRKGKNWATVIAQEGDTLEGLAQLIGLDEKEANKWLRKQDGQYYQMGDKIIAGCRYKTPNVMYSDQGDDSALIWRKGGFGFTNWWMEHRQSQFRNAMTAQGFKVIENRRASLADMQKTMGREDIYGWFVIGHGDKKAGLLEAADGNYVTPYDLTSVQHHKLARVIFYVCYVGKQATGALPGNGYRDLVSKNGSIAITSEVIHLAFNGWDDVPEFPNP